MRLPALILFLLVTCRALSQNYAISGSLIDESNYPLKSAEVKLINDKDSIKTTSGKDGRFASKPLQPGVYFFSVSAHGYEDYLDTVHVTDRDVNLGAILVQHITHMLDEVKIVEKVLAMVQKDDTLEFNSGAYKVNPDADAADLLRKMPTIDMADKKITAQGETVTKIMVDGKPFFGSDPYAALKNLPADVIDKIQVYNEKTDQEQFTGFSEGATTKTVNIITKSNKKQGVFGKIYGGAGLDNSNDGMYGAGFSLNRFAGDRRITVTGQSNNVNIQNFSDENAAGGGGTGLSTTNAAGINYTDKWGKKTEVSGSYLFNDVNNSVIRHTVKTYTIAADSGQVYTEDNPSSNHSFSHRFNLRLNYTFDSMNSVLFQPNISFTKNDGASGTIGSTVEGSQPLNQTTNSAGTSNTIYALSGNLLYRHKFHKKGRTFSLSLNANNNSNDGTNLHTAENIYYTSPSLNDTINQQTRQSQGNWNLSGNAAYTEPVGKKGVLKLEYNASYLPSLSERNTYDFSIPLNSYSRYDSQYSNNFTSANLAHKAGASYQLHLTKFEWSVGVNYQLTQLRSVQEQPVSFRLSQDFQNLLPVASVNYKITKSKNLRLSYTTNTQAPSVNQLQNVVNNTDPLHLYVGNPALKQPYRHNITLRYNTTAIKAKTNFSASVTGSVAQHYIASGTIIANNDTSVAGNILAKGSQLTSPMNLEGYSSVNGNISYGLQLAFIKCHLNLSLNASYSHVPVMINSAEGFQESRNSGFNVSVNSNISENVDFSVSGNMNVVSNANSINSQMNTTYYNEGCRATVYIIFLKSLVFSTVVSYTANSGLSAGYNKDYALWNMSLGKKILKKHKGDIRLTAFDILNQNNNIQHTVADIYIQDTRSNILQRYFLLVFTYKLSEFKSQSAHGDAKP